MTAQTWFIADTHFMHKGILEMCNRPFRTLAQHDRYLVDAWNNTVRKHDIVWFLGDFAFGTVEDCGKLLAQLHGRKRLVRGNHDKASFCQDPGWEQVHDLVEEVIDGQRVVMCHYPMASWRGSHRGTVHLYGHVHGRLEVPGAADVGVDTWGYRPIGLREIVQRVTAPQHDRPTTVNEKLTGQARQILDIADRQWDPFERGQMAAAIEQTVVQTALDVYAARTPGR